MRKLSPATPLPPVAAAAECSACKAESLPRPEVGPVRNRQGCGKDVCHGVWSATRRLCLWLVITQCRFMWGVVVIPLDYRSLCSEGSVSTLRKVRFFQNQPLTVTFTHVPCLRLFGWSLPWVLKPEITEASLYACVRCRGVFITRPKHLCIRILYQGTQMWTAAPLWNGELLYWMASHSFCGLSFRFRLMSALTRAKARICHLSGNVDSWAFAHSRSCSASFGHLRLCR